MRKIVLIIAVLVLIVFFTLGFEEKSKQISPKPKIISDKGIYITEYVAQSDNYFKSIREKVKKAGINTYVIDAKRALQNPLLELIKEKKLIPNVTLKPNPWLEKLTKQLHQEGAIVTARLVVFKDDHLIIARPDLAVRLKDGNLYRDHKGGRWADPYSDEVRLYNAMIAEIAALSGVDEVQFDYIRFPAEGKAYGAVFPFKKEGVSRVEIITSFLKEVKERVKKYNVSIAADIFGVTAWQSKEDIQSLGQDLKKMAGYIDVLSPMLYPSHFHSGYDGYENPGSHPYYFINTGVKKALEIISNEAVVVVPWLQGFNLKSPNFGPAYIKDQIRACQDAGINRYLIWNANNRYDALYPSIE